MYGNKLFITGLFVFLAGQLFIPSAEIVGTIVMGIGVFLLWLDK